MTGKSSGRAERAARLRHVERRRAEGPRWHRRSVGELRRHQVVGGCADGFLLLGGHLLGEERDARGAELRRRHLADAQAEPEAIQQHEEGAVNVRLPQRKRRRGGGGGGDGGGAGRDDGGGDEVRPGDEIADGEAGLGGGALSSGGAMEKCPAGRKKRERSCRQWI